MVNMDETYYLQLVPYSVNACSNGVKSLAFQEKPLGQPPGLPVIKEDDGAAIGFCERCKKEARETGFIRQNS